ncbi:O-linked N-acetylglucosamine transferase, SPINDLY family protein [Nostoc sp. FACHB-152]|uniref:O-linked N-acetylglucosamine transferase, SPINDLY family protein n=1 Tax=unclassified Nostoc TaxID=2593658 RepID=UPI00168740EC|nr:MULTISPECIES: O-linked N-acetylglucosamine transferase, SPINDLY family protein [unclassified Nostoc]MBD2447599.1 O-linked N-acetylglucosamine transferase, SPINDLY family protein [Nostoc sp. FACHB-152]MBD2469371.1 O-linked N-acetylglucosamine transferase, SPINDLY family protein [Nostoc sp. FACHB-145]
MLIEATKTSATWQETAYNYLVQGNYNLAANCYEQAITFEPDVKSNYLYLGLVLLLQGQQAEAEATWLMVMMEDDESEINQCTQELGAILSQEATRQEALKEAEISLTIRQQIKEICPTDIKNLLHLVLLEVEQKNYTGDELTDLGIITLLQSQEELAAVNWELLNSTLQNVLETVPLHSSSLELATAIIPYVNSPGRVKDFLKNLIPYSVSIAYSLKQPEIAGNFIDLGLKLEPKNQEMLFHRTSFYYMESKYAQGLETARLVYSIAQQLPDIIFAHYLILKGLISSSGTNWQAADQTWAEHELLLEDLVKQHPEDLPILQVSRVFNTNYFTPYLQDEPQKYRRLRAQLAEICKKNINTYYHEAVERYQQGHIQRKKLITPTKKLKIGYLSHCFNSHSVGWLARWLIKHHNRDRFEINGYCIYTDPVFDPLHEWYLNHFDNTHKSENVQALANKIYDDEIDILIDLDSITLDLSCILVSLKAAPIQATWLGWDASGIPAVDYFIADPYVLPNAAEEYYSEKIWRLPQTYIAVDGFEVGVPTLRRDDLNIPADAVVYFSGQRGFKRHPDTARLQIKIIKEVPNSYFLIKGDADEESMNGFFYQLAEEEGVAIERLRFLPNAPSEATHRANLGIVDIVLDTYPYNGATTTLETLWMGIPLVTRVGEQFAARNSYTMMVNAGITEGIAWTDAEYVEWGMRLGKDESLRQQVVKKLKLSRQTAPLWNGKQFACEMEKAYEQMWQKYIDANEISS